MERISTLLEKIEALQRRNNVTTIDIDLMLDYTRVLYADLLDWRSKVAPLSFVPQAEKIDNTSLAAESQTQPLPTVEVSPNPHENNHTTSPIYEPTLDELATAYEQEPEADFQDVVDAIEEKNEVLATVSNNPDIPIITSPITTPYFSSEVERLQEIDTTPAPPQPTKPRDDIRKYIGINEKFIFIDELFHNNKEAYEEVLNELMYFNKTEDAIEWLEKTVATPYEWKSDDFTLQDFYRVLESYYSRRSS